jgi:hypothetical protein
MQDLKNWKEMSFMTSIQKSLNMHVFSQNSSVLTYGFSVFFLASTGTA